MQPSLHPSKRSKQVPVFERYRPLITLFTRFFSVFPTPLLRELYSVFEYTPGYLGLGVRYCLVKVLASACGDNVYIARGVEIRGWDKLVIGSNVSFQKNCYIDATGGIFIRDDVSIAHHSSLISFNHTWDDPTRPIRKNPYTLAPITIANDVWIGAGCRILLGVRVASRVVVAAGAVVTKDVPAGSVVGGVPAKVLRSTAR